MTDEADLERIHLDAINVMNKLFESRDGRPVESATMSDIQHRIVTRALLDGLSNLAAQRERIKALEDVLGAIGWHELTWKEARDRARAALGARK